MQKGALGLLEAETKRDRKRKSYSQPLISKSEQFIQCKSCDHECLRAVILSDYPVLSGGWKKPRRLMFCMVIRWQACNSELITHESGAGIRGFKKQQHFITIYFFCWKDTYQAQIYQFLPPLPSSANSPNLPVHNSLPSPVCFVASGYLGDGIMCR